MKRKLAIKVLEECEGAYLDGCMPGLKRFREDYRGQGEDGLDFVDFVIGYMDRLHSGGASCRVLLGRKEGCDILNEYFKD